eukprot:5336312-Ditylum_brightwellii.AAC.1
MHCVSNPRQDHSGQSKSHITSKSKRARFKEDQLEDTLKERKEKDKGNKVNQTTLCLESRVKTAKTSISKT